MDTSSPQQSILFDHTPHFFLLAVRTVSYFHGTVHSASRRIVDCRIL